MFSELRQQLAGLFAAHHRRSAVSRKCPPLERLEDRSMLSASFGPVPYEFGMPAPRVLDLASFAPQSQQVVGYEYESVRGAAEIGPSVGQAKGQPMMEEMVGVQRLELVAYGPGGAVNSAIELYVLGPAPQMPASMIRAATAHELAESLNGVGPSNQTAAMQSPTNNINTGFTNSSEPDTDFVLSSPIVSMLRVNSGAGAGQGTKGSSNPTAPTQPSQVSYGSNVSESLHENAESAFERSFADMMAVSQLTSRDASSASTLSATAHDVVLENYVPQIPLSMITGPYDQSIAGQLGSDVASSTANDGFVGISGESTVDDTFSSNDAVAQERDAVNSVLRDLHDIDIQPATPAADAASTAARSDARNVDSEQTDVPVDIAGNELPVGEVDGGMVLLQSTGNVNDSELDLTTLYADQLEKMIAPIGMETSVGVYEAIDVAADETPMGDHGVSNGASAETPHDILVNEKLPAHDKSSSNKAAAIIGATTLTGALVWMNRNREREDAPTAEERCRRG